MVKDAFQAKQSQGGHQAVTLLTWVVKVVTVLSWRYHRFQLLENYLLSISQGFCRILFLLLQICNRVWTSFEPSVTGW